MTRPNDERPAFRLPLSTGRVDRAIDDELRFHLAERIDELVARGMTREEAEAEVRRRFGDYERYRRETRDIDVGLVRERRRLDLADAVRREAGHALRTLARSRTFSGIAILTLALGVGATTAIYTLVDHVVLRPLPFAAADRLVAIAHPATVPGRGDGIWGVSDAGYFHFAKNNRTLGDIGASAGYEGTLLSEGNAERVEGAQVTASLLRTLRARTILGRTILPDDDVPGAEPVALLSAELWRTRFGADRAVIGRVIELDGQRRRIIGVLAPDTPLPRGLSASGQAMAHPGLWIPFRLDPAARPINWHRLSVIGRLRDGVTPADAQRDLARLTRQLPELFPQAYSSTFIASYNFRVAATPLQDAVVGSTGRVLWILLGAVALVFLIAAANVANLFLVRTEGRRRETAIRSALGAGRAHLAAHYLSESLILAIAAGALGLLLAQLGLRALLAAAPPELPRLDEVRLGWSAIAFAAGASLVAGLVFGLFPLVRARIDLTTLRDNARGTTASRRQHRVRSGLVIAQVALALVLLAAAGLLLRSFQELRTVRPGFDPHRAIAFDVALPWTTYRTYDATTRLHRALLPRLAAIPGVTSVGAGSGVPLDNFGGCSLIFVEDRPTPKGEEPPCVGNMVAAPGYFDALGIPVRGQRPAWGDIDGKTGAVVITKALADRYWPGESAIGKGIRPGGAQPPYYRVVGVTDDLRADGLDKPPVEAVFYPLEPIPGAGLWSPPRYLSYIVRTQTDRPEALTSAIRAALAEVDATVPLARVRTLDAVVSQSMVRTSFTMMLLGVAAAMALVLSAVGMYGVISYVVGQRRGEIGIRMALGARVSQVSGMVVRQSMALAGIGVAIGIAGALATTRLLRAILFGVSPTDPLTLGGVAAVLLAIAAISSAAPARRAAKVDPVEALRSD
jgi:putative ABC transport system permease protein